VETLSKLVSIKAVNVRSGEGQSEWDRVKFLEPILKEMGLDTKVVVAPDPLVPEGRPNLLAVLPARTRLEPLVHRALGYCASR